MITSLKIKPTRKIKLIHKDGSTESRVVMMSTPWPYLWTIKDYREKLDTRQFFLHNEEKLHYVEA